MPRKPRLHVPGAFYHVILRGNSRRDIFLDESDRLVWQDILSKALATYGQRLHAYCWMTNHIHMAVQIGQVPLGRCMGAIACRYAKAFNKKYCRSGHLFERRHRAILVEQDGQLIELVRYIHQNPLRANLVSAVSDYPWSSHSAYSGANKPRYITTEFVLNLFGTDTETACRRYLHFMAISPTPMMLTRLRANRRRIEEHSEGESDHKPGLEFEIPECGSKTLKQLIGRHCAEHAISPLDLQKPSRIRQLSRLRAEIALEATEKKLATLTDLARLFGRSQPALSQAINRLRRKKNKL